MILSILLCFLSIAWTKQDWKDCGPGKARFHLDLTWETGSPDGFAREMIHVNGQFPGPTLNINQGDAVEIVVHNHMPYNTTVHFHGIEQIGTPWSDGVPGLSQRPILPGSSFTYTWTAYQYGSYFYHAHSRGQIDDGLYGAITIKPSLEEPKSFGTIAKTQKDLDSLVKAEAEVKPLIFGDWRHVTSSETWELEQAAGIETACVDSLLVNRKGFVNCWSREDIQTFTSPPAKQVLGGLNYTDKGCLQPQVLIALFPGKSPTNISSLPKEIFEVCTPTNGSTAVIEVSLADNEWVAFDMISTAGFQTLTVSIDEHPLWIYAVDGRYVEPILVEAITLENGERYSVFTKLDKPAGDYKIRSSGIALAQIMSTTATLSYAGLVKQQKASVPYTNMAGGNTTADVAFFSQAQQKGFPASSPAKTVDQTIILGLVPAGASYLWSLNGTSYSMSLEDTSPLLFASPSTVHSNLTITTKNNTWVDLILNVTTPGQPPHPIHKHSNKGYIIGAGTTVFNYSSVEEALKYILENFNFENPPLRDTFTTPPSATGPTWLAVRYHVVNPGAFLLHCHIQSHLVGGMAMAILDGVDEWPEVPGEYEGYH
ncbi:laccase TilA [Mytilinidion resinicola]|uniref:Laccase TilA n=1 Tax=Mytilinidion resinicola TaxID=574789 RepID=A0A6A6YTU8_9PEZI|nr:laccase TilA [Mytilinidion resinicola]KAF2811395.1 laccase TilA [Mytilinidion resinicola]